MDPSPPPLAEGPHFSFDDGSVFSLDQEPTLQPTFHAVYGEIPHIDVLMAGAAEYFWETRKLPDGSSWPEPFRTRAELMEEVIRRLLHRSLAATQPALRQREIDQARRNFLKVAPESMKYVAELRFHQSRYDEAARFLSRYVQIRPELLYLYSLAAARAGHPNLRELYREVAVQFQSPYLDRVVCPDCGWIPIQHSLWGCEKCGASFDTFVTRAKCPSCPNSWESTMCLACLRMIPHRSWWLPPPGR